MMNPYTARPRAAAYAAHEGEVEMIRAADTLDDLIACDVEPGAGTATAGSGASAAAKRAGEKPLSRGQERRR
jgi:hypothetical protein